MSDPTVGELFEQHIKLKEEVTEIEEALGGLRVALVELVQEQNGVLEKFIRDIFTEGCPVNDPQDPSWDRYFALIKQLGEHND